jgi:3-oxoacyl-[acyl-carrier-protein] synthase II
MLNVAVVGGAWITASGVGCINGGDAFSMPEGALPKLRREMLSSKPEERWGRLDDYSKAGLIGASLALKDAGLDSRISASTAVIVSTASGSSDVDHAYYRTVIPQGGLLASPNLFAYTLPNCMLGEISIRYGLTGFTMVISQTTPDMLSGILGGVKFISYGLCEEVIAGYCNTEASIHCLDTSCKPGAVFLVLQEAKEKSRLTFDGSEFMYNGRVPTDLLDLMRELTHDVLTESQI